MLLLVAAALAGCAASPLALPPGASPADAQRELGPPTGDHALPGGGRRLEYARGPMGRQTYMLDFDAAGRLQAAQQVLEERRFNAILAGMRADEVLRRIGRPARTWAIPRQHQIVWSYRYETPFCQWFMVGMGEDDVVVDTAYGPDPACDDDDMGAVLGLRR